MVEGRARPPQIWTNMTIWLEKTGKAIKLDFWAGYEKDGGYTPDLFLGTVDEAGQITASPPDYHTLIYNYWPQPGCYNGWTIENGELSGMLSQDGRAVSGSIVESFRAVPQGPVFTIRSHFSATSPW